MSELYHTGWELINVSIRCQWFDNLCFLDISPWPVSTPWALTGPRGIVFCYIISLMTQAAKSSFVLFLHWSQVPQHYYDLYANIKNEARRKYLGEFVYFLHCALTVSMQWNEFTSPHHNYCTEFFSRSCPYHHRNVPPPSMFYISGWMEQYISQREKWPTDCARWDKS